MHLANAVVTPAASPTAHEPARSGAAAGRSRVGWRIWAGLALIGAAVALTHGGAIRNGFVGFDDDIHIYENPHVRAGLSLREVAWAFRFDGHETYYHPLTWVSLMADAQLFGVEPWGFHLTNVLLHAASAAALFLLLWRTTGRAVPSVLAAVLWAVHPLTVEAVAWATERKAVLSTALALLACHAYVSWTTGKTRRRAVALGILSTAAILAKPAMVVLPGLFLALDVWPLQRFSRPGRPEEPGGLPWRLLLEKLPLVAGALVLLGVAVLSARGQTAPSGLAAPIGLRALHAVASIRTYLVAAIWPVDLAVFHPFPRAVSPAELLAGVGVLAGGTVAAALAARRTLAPAAGWAWFLIALAPHLGMVQPGMWPSWADRFSYVPLMGLSSAVVFGAHAARPLPRAVRALGWAAALVAIVALGRATARQVGVWRDSLTLYEHATKLEPRAERLLFNYGRALLKVGRVEEAKAQFQAAVDVEWRLAEAQSELGSILWMMEGDVVGAEDRYRMALAAKPDYAVALFNLANLLRQQGRVAEALPFFERFIRVARPGMEPQLELARGIVGR